MTNPLLRWRMQRWLLLALLAVARLPAQTAEELFTAGVQHLDKGELTRAIDAFNGVIEKDPTASGAYFNRGLARQRAGDLSGARADLSQAIHLAPRQHEAYTFRGMIRREAGDLKGALEDLNRACELSPDSAALTGYRAEVKVMLKDFDGAGFDLDRTIELDDRHPRAFGLRAQLRYSRADYPGALADYDRAIQLKGDDPRAFARRGWVRFYLLDFEGAAKDAQVALSFDAKDLPSERLLGYALFANADANATAHLTVVIDQAPGHESAFPYMIRHLALLRKGGGDDRLVAAARLWPQGDWARALAHYLTGELTEDELDKLASAPLEEAKRLGQECEAHFYIGMKRLVQNDRSTARLRFRAALATNQASFVEHALAHAELNRLR